MQTQKITIKNPNPKKTKAKDPKLALLCTNAAEFLEQDRKNKKKRTKEYRENITQEQKEQILVTGNNIIDAFKKEKSVTSIRSCIFIAIKMATILASAQDLKKTSIGLGNFRAGN